jgi:hypothetical protein
MDVFTRFDCLSRVGQVFLDAGFNGDKLNRSVVENFVNREPTNTLLSGISTVLLSKLLARLADSNQFKIKRVAKHFGFPRRMSVSDAQDRCTNFAVAGCCGSEVLSDGGCDGTHSQRHKLPTIPRWHDRSLD